MSHYEEFYDNSADLTMQQWEDAYKPLEFYQDDEGKLWPRKTIKHSDGKPEGARYCFIEELTGDRLGKLIARLVHEVDNKLDAYNLKLRLNDIRSELMKDKNNREIVHDLITLRSKAITSKKYTVDGYKEKIDINLLLDALARHYIKYSLVDIRDEESECLHLSHIWANIILIGYQLEHHYE